MISMAQNLKFIERLELKITDQIGKTRFQTRKSKIIEGRGPREPT